MPCGCFRPPMSFTSVRSTSPQQRGVHRLEYVGARPHVLGRMARESRSEVPVHRDRAGRRRAGQCRRARVRQHPHVDVLARSGQRRSHLDSAGGLAPSKSTACLDAARLYCRRVPSTTNGVSRPPMRAFGERCVHCGQRAVVVDGHGVGRCARHHHEHTSARETCIRRREAARRAIDVARGAQ
jgi:hypothetical protein